MRGVAPAAARRHVGDVEAKFPESIWCETSSERRGVSPMPDSAGVNFGCGYAEGVLFLETLTTTLFRIAVAVVSAEPERRLAT